MVLEKGGSQDEMKTLEDFLGRRSSTEAFYRELGLGGRRVGEGGGLGGGGGGERGGGGGGRGGEEDERRKDDA